MAIAWAGGPIEEMPQQQMPVQRVYPRHKWREHREVKPKTFEQKAKDTVIFIGDNWGYGTLLVIILAGGLLRKRLLPWIVNPKKALKDWVNK